MNTTAPPSFELPPGRSASRPPEARGLARDDVRLLVARPGRLEHVRFRDIGEHLRPGDLLVVNTSATLPAAMDGSLEPGRRVVVHFSTPLDDGTWVVELRAPDGSGPVLDARPGSTVRLPGGRLHLLAHPAGDPPPVRLWLVQVIVDAPVERYLQRHGRPITYGYLDGRWPLSAYQTVFGRRAGSAEMASAARPFTERLVLDLITRGVAFAPVLLHAGVSSLEKHEPPQPERFAVPEATARLVNHTRAAGGRVVAVGTTATRAVESVARPDGTVEAGEGWTELVLGPGRRARVVTGLVTGWHDPAASHLHLLAAVARGELVQDAYQAALGAGYLWHEFGDSALFLA